MPTGSTPELAHPENPNDPGRGPIIIGLTWTFFGLALVAVVVRLRVRFKQRFIGADDWIMVLALILQAGCQFLYTMSFRAGHGKHDRNLTPPQMMNIFKWMFISAYPNQVVSIVARLSSVLLLIRLFGTKLWLKWYLIVFATVQCSLGVTYGPIHWTQADPIEGMWNPSLEAKRHHPMRVGIIVYVLQATHALSDITFILFPVIIVWRLNMSMRRKVGLIVMMAFSLITLVLCLMKAIQVNPSVGEGESDDALYNDSLTMLWCGLEQCLVIILGCVPAMRVWVKDLPMFQSMNSGFSRVVAHWTQTGNKSTNKTGKPDPGDYYDLELQSHSDPLRRPQATYNIDASPPTVQTGFQIRQTNEFSINYPGNGKVKPNENV